MASEDSDGEVVLWGDLTPLAADPCEAAGSEGSSTPHSSQRPPRRGQRQPGQAEPRTAWAPFEGDLVGGMGLPDDPYGGKGLPSRLRAPPDESPKQRAEREAAIGCGLARAVPDMDQLTIATLGTADTVPLGTDLDPVNSYNNAWAAKRVSDAFGKVLLTHDLARRVLDAENLGFTYGERVLRRTKTYDVAGVRKAVDHFLQAGLEVIVVGKRQSLREDLKLAVEVGNCHVLIGDSSDDVFILKQAFEHRCPIVSRDNFRSQQSDLRIDSELRRWYSSQGAALQVKFTFDRHGEFLPDHDLRLQPVLRRRWPARSGRSCS